LNAGYSNYEIVKNSNCEVPVQPGFQSLPEQSQVANYLRSNDGYISALGNIEQWPQSLQTAFNLVILAKSPRFVTWGKSFITLYNDSCVDFFGSEYSTALGKPLASLWVDIWQELQPAFEQALTGIPIYDLHLPVNVRKQYSEHSQDSRIQLTPIYESGEVAGIYCEFVAPAIGSDVSNLHRTKDALRKTEELLEEGMVAGRMVVWELDIKNQHIKYSDNAKDIIGFNTDDPAVAWASLHPDDVDEVRLAVNLAINERKPLHKLSRRIRPDNGQVLWVEMKGRVVLDSKGEPEFLRGMMIDLTDRINAENELKNANRHKDEFLAMLAHELRNPLAPISTSAQILKIPHLDEANIKHASNTIARQVKHMTDLIDDLMDVSRVTRGLVKLQADVVDLKIAIANAVEQARPIIEARYHTLVTALTQSSTFVRGDQTRLIQIISNLLNNAAKYTPEAGHISLTLEVDNSEINNFEMNSTGMNSSEINNSKINSSEINSSEINSSEINNAKVVITVTDNGIGIQPSLLPHIFDLFTQAERSPDRSQGGLGLGLTLVKSITELHGGHVQARSDGQGSGSTFSISLPLLLELNTQPTPTNLLANNTDAEPLVLMIVDDNLDAAASLATLMTAKGHQVITRHNAYSALEHAEKKSIDVFILDIGLPDIDGYDLVRRLKANPQTADALFIALTGYGQPQDRALSKAAGFDHHFVKPVNIDDLVNLLANKSAQKFA
jgi:PAS domain S-box-containing protein